MATAFDLIGNSPTSAITLEQLIIDGPKGMGGAMWLNSAKNENPDEYWAILKEVDEQRYWTRLAEEKPELCLSELSNEKPTGWKALAESIRKRLDAKRAKQKIEKQEEQAWVRGQLKDWIELGGQPPR